MAYGYNTNTPIGLRPVRMKASAAYNSQLSLYYVLNAYANSIFTYDPVTYDAGNNGTLTPCGAGVATVGVVVGFEYYDATGKYQFSKYWPGGTATLGNQLVIAQVIDDPSVMFDMQASNATNVAASFATVSIEENTNAGGAGPYYRFGKNANWNVGNPGGGTLNPAGGNPATGLGAYYLDVNSISTGSNTKNVKILQFTQYPGNTVAGVQSSVALYNNALVRINNHIMSGGTGTVGV